MKKTLLIFFILSLPYLASARPFIADISPRKIDITHDFEGTEILAYGAREESGNIIIVVRGPEKNFIIRKKQKIAGVWVNRESVEFSGVPSFYAIANSQSLEKVSNDPLLKSLQVGTEFLEFKKNDESNQNKINEFQTALIENKQKSELFTKYNYEVSFWGETLFRTIVNFPKNIPKGEYTIEVYLFKDGVLSTMQAIPLFVEKVGFEAFVFDASRNYPILYGIISVILALSIGWLSRLFFGR
jgi:uncharacterized protein (TIGR02186 family)